MKVDARLVFPGGEYSRVELRVAPGEVESATELDQTTELVVVVRASQAGAIVLTPDQACELATILLVAAKEHQHEGAREMVATLIEQGRRYREAREKGAN